MYVLTKKHYTNFNHQKLIMFYTSYFTFGFKKGFVAKVRKLKVAFILK